VANAIRSSSDTASIPGQGDRGRPAVAILTGSDQVSRLACSKPHRSVRSKPGAPNFRVALAAAMTRRAPARVVEIVGARSTPNASSGAGNRSRNCGIPRKPQAAVAREMEQRVGLERAQSSGAPRRWRSMLGSVSRRGIVSIGARIARALALAGCGGGSPVLLPAGAAPAGIAVR
jgi:hypothetical protein